ncbi:MAG: ABC transporter permease [Acidobacteriales bacterium]|nr:ABC transporter permease [Terriglobales bacterium]
MNWLRQFFTRHRHYDELSQSIREHLDEKAADLMDRGLTREQAERTARREFGNVTQIEECSREVWQWPTLESILSDAKYAIRQMRKAPGFSTVVVVILALGIGANTTVFSIVDAVMLRPLPFAQPQRLVEVKASGEQHFESSDVSYPDFFDWRTQAHSFEHLLAYHDTSDTLTGVNRPLHLDGEVVSWEMVPTLGISPELGRGFSPEDEKQGSRVILISHTFWKTQFAGDRSVLGRSISLGGNLYTIIGVMPATFRFPVTQPNNSFWTTLAVDADVTDIRPLTANRSTHFLTVVGRLKPGVTVAQADQEMKVIAARLAKQYPETNTRHSSAWVQSELASVLGDTSTLLLVVLGAVMLVLLIACGNIANLLLARVRDRHREIAMRSALGADRARIVRQLLAESLLLGVAGGIAGCLLAFACTPAVLRLIGDSVPRAADAGVDLPMLGFALGISLLSGVVFGIVPALTASKTDLVSTLKEGGYSDIPSHDWLRSSVIVGQVAVGIVLTVGAGLLITSFVRLTRMDEGFTPDHLLTFTFDLPDATYKDTRSQFYQQYFERLRALPGVQSAAGVHNLPMTYDLAMISFEDPEHPLPKGQQPNADLTFISTDYFHTLQVPLLRGRDFTDSDDMKAPQVMIVNEAFAKRYFPGEDVLGKKLKPGALNGMPGGPPLREIVGVVGNVRHFGVQREMPPAIYLPASQLPNWCCLRSVVRTSVDPMSLEPAVRRLVSSMDPNLPVTQVRTMDELFSLQLAQPRFAMILLGAFAGLALLLTVVGLYGVMAYSVSRRTREIGVRLALGAQRNTVMRMILHDAAVLLLIGTAIGVAASIVSASVLKSTLYGVDPHDPLVLTVVCISVTLTGLLAAYIPSIRAASIDPMKALRTE